MGCPDHGSLQFPLDRQIHGRSGNLWPNMVSVCLGCYTAQAELKYVTIHLTVSKTDPFGQGVDVIIGCSGTQVCRACSAWDLIQSNQAKQASPTAPCFQLSGQPLSRGMMVGYIKGLLAKLGLNPSLYSGHIICTGGVTTSTAAGLRDWEINSLGHWKSNTYWAYIRETTDMKINCARRMACTPASITFICS